VNEFACVFSDRSRRDVARAPSNSDVPLGYVETLAVRLATSLWRIAIFVSRANWRPW